MDITCLKTVLEMPITGMLLCSLIGNAMLGIWLFVLDGRVEQYQRHDESQRQR